MSYPDSWLENAHGTVSGSFKCVNCGKIVDISTDITNFEMRQYKYEVDFSIIQTCPFCNTKQEVVLDTEATAGP